MAFPALLDTCSIYGAYLCDTMLTLAEAGTFRPLWSPAILTELRDALVERGHDVQAVEHRIRQMLRTFPDAEVTGYEPLIPSMTNHPKDRHVLAAAVRGDAAIIVTFNLSDFPAEALAPYDIEAVHVDDFLLDQLDLHPGATLKALKAQVSRYNRPPQTIAELLPILARAGVSRFADEVTRHLR
jgi:predicted nucleic acid-binding protein